MKIVFWGEKKEVGTTFNMTVMACMASLKYSFSTAMFSGKFNNLDLELSFHGGRELFVAESGNYAQMTDYGFDHLMKEEQGITIEQLQKNMKPIIENKIYCLPAGKKQQIHYSETLAPLMTQLISVAEQCYDIVFIDCGCKMNLFTRKMLREADIVVVNMEQDSESFSQFIQRHYEINGRIFYMISNYFVDDVYNKISIERIFRMGEENIGTIPYNIWLARAFLSGQVEQYFKQYLDKKIKDSQKTFFKEVEETVFLLLKEKLYSFNQ